MKPQKAKKKSILFGIIRKTISLIYPKYELVGIEKLAGEPVVIVGNHSQLHGPITCELYFPENSYTWCAGQMMELKEVPAYAFKDFWSQKPAYTHWFFKIASYLIAPFSVVIFNNARTIAVHRDARIISTFRNSIEKLKSGNHVVIFPEHDVKHNNIVYDFQDRFIDVARFYYKQTGKALTFVPMYIAPKLKKMIFGKPITFSPEAPIDEERQRICKYLMAEITDIARAQPKHTVVPYRNIPKKQYPVNIPEEVADDAQTRG